MDTFEGTQIAVVRYRMRFERPFRPSEARHLRGFFGRRYTEETLVHHHEADGSLRYAYPRVQFKVLDQAAYLIGLAEGGDLVTGFWTEIDQAVIGSEQLQVLELTVSRSTERIGEADDLIEYCFLTPWLGQPGNHACASHDSMRPDDRTHSLDEFWSATV